MDGSSSSDTPKQGGQTQDRRKEQGDRDPQREPAGQQEAPPKDGQTPRGNRDDPEESDMRTAPRSPDYATQDPLRATDGKDQWGNLPIHLRELFRAEGGQRLPARYRDWIDSYYRRLNRQSGG